MFKKCQKVDETRSKTTAAYGSDQQQPQGVETVVHRRKKSHPHPPRKSRAGCPQPPPSSEAALPPSGVDSQR
ncbi:hypothetical protein JCGZ_22937 [Jatropha curcas]|uniref:Uncharacterized protein n=1 Tax=Jatropha curcas TaxID=180498 RepID=A0A067JT55_JATCU|nr:hypothetical protein JCGZ_22937 [Jatropha curcas]